MRRALPDAAAAVGIALLAASAWLFAPRDRSGAPTLPAARIVLVDVSRSAVLRRSGWQGFVVARIEHEIRDAEAHGEDPWFVLFGARVRRVLGAEAIREIDSLPGNFPGAAGEGFSDLAGGLRVAAEIASEPGRAGARVVMLGDGTYTGADPRSELDRLARAGVPIDRVALPPPDREEALCGPLELPRELEVGAPIPVDCELFYAPGNAAPPETVAIPVYHEFAKGHRTTEVVATLPTGVEPDADGYLRGRLRATVGPVEPGWNRIAVGRRSEGDSKRSASRGIVRSVGSTSVGIAVHLAGAFDLGTTPGLDVVFLRGDEVARSLADLEVLVTVDVPFDRLPLEVLASYVRGGGRWLAMIDLETVASFEEERSEILPLRPPRDLPPRDVTFLVDRSGSMSGERIEVVQRAVLELFDAAPPSDALYLREFATRLGEPAILLPRSESRSTHDRLEAKRRISDALSPGTALGGPTAIVRTLEELAAERERSRDDGLVFLLTDGNETVDQDPISGAKRVRERLAATRTRLVLVLASGGADQAFLQELVGPDETIQPAHLIGAIVRDLFKREQARGRLREGPERILPTGGLSQRDELGSDILRAQLASLAEPWPEVQRRVRAESAPAATTLWTTSSGDPLLAMQRVGRGLAVGCAFGPSSVEYAQHGTLGRLFLPLVRALARGRGDTGPLARFAGDRLVVEGLPADAPAVLEARIFAASAEPGDAPIAELSLAPPAVGDPRLVREASWPSARGGGFLSAFESPDTLDPRGWGSAAVPRVEVRAVEGASGFEPIDLPLALPIEPEELLPRPRLPAIPSPHADARRSSAPSPHPSAPWVLLSGMVLLAGAGAGGTFSRRAR